MRLSVGVATEGAEAKERVVPGPHLGTSCTGPVDQAARRGCQPDKYKSQTPILFNIIMLKKE